jgi:acyl-CoA thioesterase
VSPSLSGLLDLEEIDRDLFRSTLVYADPYALYGGQVAAQALLAAGRTVDGDLVPHSLAASRAWYTGTLHDRAGALVASLTQEVLARPRGSG